MSPGLLDPPSLDDKVTDVSRAQDEGEVTGAPESVDSLNFTDIRNLEQQPQSLDSKSAANFLFPTTRPIGRGEIEIGYAKVSGTGVIEIPFESGFANQPVLVQTTFGYISISIPVGFDWDLDIDFVDRDFNFDFNIDWNEIRIPSMSFLWSIDSDTFEIFNSWGDTWVTYIALYR